MKSQSCPPLPSSSQDGAPQLPRDSGLFGVLSVALVSSTRLGTPWAEHFPGYFGPSLGQSAGRPAGRRGRDLQGLSPKDSALLTLPSATPQPLGSGPGDGELLTQQIQLLFPSQPSLRSLPGGTAGGEKPVNLCLLFGFPLVIV